MFAVSATGSSLVFTILQILVDDLRDAVRQGADALGTETELAVAAQPSELVADLQQALARRNGRSQAQDVGDQPPDGLGDGGGFGAGFGAGDEGFEGLLVPILV